MCDHTIVLEGAVSRKRYPEKFRRIKFNDPETGKTFVFLTNNFTLPASTICALYKMRWQVELFFDCLPLRTPLCVIEYPGPVGLDLQLVDPPCDPIRRHIPRYLP